METSEKIVEAYCRYVKGWFTIPNIRCGGQYEIDLLAVDMADSQNIGRYHIECSVSISGGFSKLTAKKFSKDELKKRVQGPAQRRTVGYFVERKFNLKEVKATLGKYGFCRENYQKVIVTWGVTEEAQGQAKEQGVEVWDFRDLLNDIAKEHGKENSYFADDTVRTIQLFVKTLGKFDD